MDDDIRNRFRGVRAGSSTTSGYGRPAQAPRPKVVIQPHARPQQILKQHSVPPVKPTPIPNVRPMPEPPKRPRRKRRGKKIIWLLLLFILLVLLGGGGFMAYKKYAKKSPPTTSNIKLKADTKDPAEAKPTGTIRFVATGDNLAFESINNAAKKPDGNHDYLPLMSSIKPFFDKSDIRLCNETTPAGGSGIGISAFPNFNAPTAWSTGFVDVGCNLMNLGSDHANDKGQPAIDAMLTTWDAQKNILAFAGANRSAEDLNKIHYFSVKGIKFAFLSYTTRSNNALTNSYGVTMYTDALAKAQIAEARKSTQLVIVSMTWGNENSVDISVDQDHIAQNLADQNVDVVVGVGPHVIQPAKILSGSNGHQTLVWFSLGNFLNSQVPVENLIGGMAVMDFDVSTQAISDPKILPFYMHYEWTAAQRKSQSQADLLSRHNFSLYPLDLAAGPLAKSQNGTTVEVQTERVKAIITKFAPIKVIKSTEF